MREHAIPQDITSYRFHIIGNMTIKQFAEIGAGVMIGVGIYATNLPTIIKWPLIVIVVGMGAMAAFVPIEERPFDHWIVTFFKVLYKPTKFFWRRSPKIPDAFLFEPDLDQNPVFAELDLKPARRQRIREYLTSVETADDLNEFDLLEMSRLQSVMATFNADHTVSGSGTKLVQKPDLRVRVRSLTSPLDDEPVLRSPDDVVSSVETQLALPPAQPDLYQRSHLAINQVAQDIAIPEIPQVSIETTAVTQEEAGYQNETTQTNDRAYVDEMAINQPITESEAAVTNVDLPFPLPPTEPNKLVGMVLSPTHDLLNDSIVEIQTETGQVARAVKTNALGQFFITTPLENGTYTMVAEKDGFVFNPIHITLTGEIVPPIEIRSA